jgi:hypothetical protein
MDKNALRSRIEQIADLLEDKQFFFVFGAPKSGTTWLQMALNAHPHIVCAGEGHFADQLAVKLSNVFGEYFDQQVIVDRNVYEGRGHYRHKRNEDYDFLLTMSVLNAFSRLEQPAGTVFIGDKTPATVGYLRVVKRLFPEAKFLNIVRDGRDTLVSTFKHVERVVRSNRKPMDVDEFLREKTKMYCERWTRSLEEAETFSQQNPGALHSVRYEDLKTDFALAFSKVLRFLGAEHSEEVLSHCEAESSFKRLSGGREAGEEDPDAFVRKGVVGDWQYNLTPDQLEVFYEVAGDWVQRLGYQVAESDPGR